jgi:hypothetical protein
MPACLLAVECHTGIGYLSPEVEETEHEPILNVIKSLQIYVKYFFVTLGVNDAPLVDDNLPDDLALLFSIDSPRQHFSNFFPCWERRTETSGRGQD